jgi:transcriptional regulator with XRE-family HTH domain
MQGRPLKDFHVTVRLKNNHLLARRKAAGMTIKQMADCIGVGSYAEYERMAKLPYGVSGHVLGTAKLIADYWGVGIDELWPDSVVAVAHPKVERELDAMDLVPLSAPEARLQLSEGTPEDDMVRRDRVNLVDSAISELSPRQQKIINMRVDGCSLDEVGAEVGVTRERVRQVEAKAHVIIRHKVGVRSRKQDREFSDVDSAAREMSDFDVFASGYADKAMRSINPHRYSRGELKMIRERYVSTGRALARMSKTEGK